jgi:hypothetical protein
MKSPVNLDVAGQWRIQWLPARGDPVEDGTFEAFRVIGPCTRCTLLDLCSKSVWDTSWLLTTQNSAYKFGNVDNTLIGSLNQTFFEPRYYPK